MLSEPAREVRKVVTVLFCDVTGSTAMGNSSTRKSCEASCPFFAVARAAIERHAAVEKFIGDAVMAVFGVPTVREDDALRAAHAAIQLRDAAQLDVGIGVNTGVVTGTVRRSSPATRSMSPRGSSRRPRRETCSRRVDEPAGRGAVDAELLPPLAAKERRSR